MQIAEPNVADPAGYHREEVHRGRIFSNNEIVAFTFLFIHRLLLVHKSGSDPAESAVSLSRAPGNPVGAGTTRHVDRIVVERLGSANGSELRELILANIAEAKFIELTASQFVQSDDHVVVTAFKSPINFGGLQYH